MRVTLSVDHRVYDGDTGGESRLYHMSKHNTVTSLSLARVYAI